MILRKKRVLLYVTSWVLRVLPLIILFACKWNSWVSDSAESEGVANFKLVTGGILCMIFIAMAVMDKLPKPNGLIFPTFLFLILLCLDSIMQDMILILGMYILGGILSLIVDQFIKELTRKIAIEDGASANGSEMRTILTELLGDKTNG